MAFAPDGKRFVTVSRDGTLRIWDRDGRSLGVIDSPDGPLQSASFLDAGTVLTASRSGVPRAWILDAERLLALARARITRELTDTERSTYRALLEDDDAAAADR